MNRGLGIGPNPQSPIPNPQSPSIVSYTQNSNIKYNIKNKIYIRQIVLEYFIKETENISKFFFLVLLILY